MTKGDDFENCMMYEVSSRLGGPSLASSFKGVDYLAKYSTIDQTVKTDTPKIIDKIISDLNVTNTTNFYNSFTKISGKSKTDIMFSVGANDYKCSLKWGDAFQLSSAGLETSDDFFTKVMKKIISNQNSQSNVTIIANVILILSQIDGIIGDEKVQKSSELKQKLNKIRGSHNSLQSNLQSILGSSRNPNVDDIYIDFKREILREALTGELVFGSKNNSCANYILSGPLANYKLVKIDDSYIDTIMSKSSVRIAAKGRGKTVGSGGKVIRLSEATIRLDVKDK